ncbi:TIGR03087 family PEP-CTERM/XrtA system glycosyltransferase [Aestuariispira insulae]|uniref:Sugar transferase (PEP-CTERM/EpsH1 system associated) n=1 Tax=Aestuariispira insulae TaxID=1461337 RepID=A0A3D9HKB9_9PROT|nr:TIGR03087 family PEP-CTERM/XrtA system glycosyltransferase [Aestuariispira insulae]RED49865.1 sugar transferase (PEP-CTERM/EpsH1 system associated) [Aestuariispira insulae]
MSRPQLLFLAQRLPFPPNKGDKIRSFNFLKRMAEDFDLHIGTFIDDPEDWNHVDGLRPYCKDLKVCGLNPKIGKLLSLRGLLTNEPLTLPYFRSSALQDWVDQLLEKERPETVFIFSSSMAQYVIDHPKCPKRVIADFVDIDSDKWRQYAEAETGLNKMIYAREARQLLRYERRASSASDAVTFVSDKEAALFRALNPQNETKIHGVENGIDAEFFSPDAAMETLLPSEHPAVTMTGAMDYKPNVDGAVWFANEVLPEIRKAIPDLAFYIVGSSPAAQVQALTQIDGVTVTGRVEDVRPYIRDAAAIVAPIHIARGIQNKVLEGMAMAKTVITTPQAYEGIEARVGEEIIVTEGVGDFAQSVVTAVTGSQDGTMGLKARSRVIQDYSWQSKYEKMKGYLDGTAS